MYSYKIGSNGKSSEVFFLTRCPFRLSKEFYRLGHDYVFASPEEDTVFRYVPATRTFLPILQTAFSRIYLTEHFLMTLSKYPVRGRGYEISVYTLDRDSLVAGDCVLSNTYIEMNFSGGYVEKDKVFLCGNDSDSRAFSLYCFDLAVPSITPVLEIPGTFGSMRLAGNNGKLAVYIAAGTPEETGSLYWTVDIAALTVTTNRLAGKYAFYGEGYIENGTVNLPVIEPDYTIRLLGISGTNVVRSVPLPTGVFEPLTNWPGNLIYVGYNFYTAKDTFYYVHVDFDRPTNAVFVPIR